MEPLLAYYERELNLLREGSREFKRKYPRIAGKMLVPGEAGGDPLVQGMVESFALTVGRIAKRLDDDYPKFTEALLESLYPDLHRLRSAVVLTLPPCGIGMAVAWGGRVLSRQPLLQWWVLAVAAGPLLK